MLLCLPVRLHSNPVHSSHAGALQISNEGGPMREKATVRINRARGEHVKCLRRRGERIERTEINTAGRRAFWANSQRRNANFPVLSLFVFEGPEAVLAGSCLCAGPVPIPQPLSGEEKHRPGGEITETERCLRSGSPQLQLRWGRGMVRL